MVVRSTLTIKCRLADRGDRLLVAETLAALHSDLLDRRVELRAARRLLVRRVVGNRAYRYLGTRLVRAGALTPYGRLVLIHAREIAYDWRLNGRTACARIAEAVRLAGFEETDIMERDDTFRAACSREAVRL